MRATPCSKVSTDSENNNGAQRDGRAEKRRAVHTADLNPFLTPGVTAICAKRKSVPANRLIREQLLGQ